jgi:hypothetical protein
MLARPRPIFPILSPQAILLQNQIQTLLQQKQSMLMMNPMDPITSNQTVVLNQVRLMFYVDAFIAS